MNTLFFSLCHHRSIAHNKYLTSNRLLYNKKWIINSSSNPQSKCSFSSSSSSITIANALKLLNLSHYKTKYSPKEIRDAYFTAAKKCHPDSPNAKVEYDNNDVDDNDDERRKEYLTNQFHAITEAYELLQKYPIDVQNDDDTNDCIISKSEEEDFRQACQEFLGVDAEIVEESKRCPLFREWLKGRTVDAFLWNLFLMKHGGLAPMLKRKKVLSIIEGDGSDNGKTKRRRRKDER